MLRSIVSAHAYFDTEAVGSPMTMPDVGWDETTVAILDLQTTDGREITQKSLRDLDRESHAWAVGTATFDIGNTDWSDLTTAFTIETSPPNVKGYEGTPLTPTQMDGVIGDLTRYEAELNR
jgi:hypothetical protein